jgi:hypothetical protein
MAQRRRRWSYQENADVPEGPVLYMPQYFLEIATIFMSGACRWKNVNLLQYVTEAQGDCTRGGHVLAVSAQADHVPDLPHCYKMVTLFSVEHKKLHTCHKSGWNNGIFSAMNPV